MRDAAAATEEMKMSSVALPLPAAARRACGIAADDDRDVPTAHVDGSGHVDRQRAAGTAPPSRTNCRAGTAAAAAELAPRRVAADVPVATTTDATPSVQDTVAVPSHPCRTSDEFTSLRVAVTVMAKLATDSDCGDEPPTTSVALMDFSTAGEKTNSLADEPPPVGVA